jgi:arylsulfatase A
MGKWKAVQQPLNTPIRLYDLEKDVGETKDLASEEPNVVAKMKKRLDAAFTPSERWKFPTPRRTPGK